jgi:alkyl sulfatase BDS1-like metallo-beta-lactamase superfamily hydrolase
LPDERVRHDRVKSALAANNNIPVGETTMTMLRAMLRVLVCISVCAPALADQQQMVPDSPFLVGRDQQAVVRVNEAIFLAYGFGNTYMLTTPAGNVIIDTSSSNRAKRARELLQKENAGPITQIILTHGHGDHTGGVNIWKEPTTQVIAQRQHYEFMNYQARLANFFAVRNAAQFNFPQPPLTEWRGNYGADVLATVMFDDKYEFTTGGVQFQLMHTPGETPDHLTVWVPKYKAAFIGDNYYESFPNLYTLRGTQPRWALDYIQSIDKVLALKPEILLPSHGEPIHGNAEITRRLTRYRDAIAYVHDAVVKGMNESKDVFTLMHEIKLPAELEVGESYGNLPWSIRGIYEGYAGWFDLNPATMYDLPMDAVLPDVVKLAGGPDPIAKLAAERAAAGQLLEALRLTEAALSADPHHAAALKVRLDALEQLRARSKNSNERGWLDYSIRTTKKQLP